MIVQVKVDQVIPKLHPLTWYRLLRYGWYRLVRYRWYRLLRYGWYRLSDTVRCAFDEEKKEEYLFISARNIDTLTKELSLNG